ncbi:hypothetical protein QGX11_gp033 [Pseudomonas phage PPSC2]|uniref:Uncharacterized protein n=1 Tax=Pseudomonas phage PPSC2 TaxID=2041350 RepID=A0A2R2YAL0_9CAUD|nr:hypothetical protein QGX11_gp033 [Pseudomonas phage PPSC2]ATN92796.1 hypothetical protein PPSC2_33 [Pseudomonas phage PPSC2]
MATGDKRKAFMGAYNTSVVLTLNNSPELEDLAMEIDTYDEDGDLSEHTYFSKEEAIAIAHEILKELT